MNLGREIVAVIRTAGFPALASFGAGVSRSQRRLLADLSESIVLAMDDDRAGREVQANLAMAPEFADNKLFSFNYDASPNAKDPGDMSGAEIREALRTSQRLK